MLNTRRTFIMATAAAGVAQAQNAAASNLNIFEAAAEGNVPRATELLNADPDLVRSRSKDGRTPLHYATAAGKPAMVTLLSSKGAELSAGPESPLIAAVDFPDAETALAMAQLILVNASDPDARRSDGKSALHLAAARGYGELVELLIHRRARWDVRDGGGKTPAQVATGDAARVLKNPGSIKQVHYSQRYLRDINGKPVTRDDTNGFSWKLINPLVTVSHFDFDKVKELLRANPGLLSTRASWDELPIEASAHVGRFDMADWLAQKGSPVSTCTAVLLGAEALVKKNLAADPLALWERGAHDLPLLAYTAYAKEQTAIAAILLSAGADVNVRAFGATTLHLAATRGHVELAALLIEKGADINLAVKRGTEILTPLGMAVKGKQEKMEQFLKDRGAKM